MRTAQFPRSPLTATRATGGAFSIRFTESGRRPPHRSRLRYCHLFGNRPENILSFPQEVERVRTRASGAPLIRNRASSAPHCVLRTDIPSSETFMLLIGSALGRHEPSAHRASRQSSLRLEELEPRRLLSVFTPAQIRHAYGFDQITFQASGQTYQGNGS